ncbi:hypothetical protein T440DRAFT_536182 [Plenodomus tracheiphilus IPT5]|uniref:Uncharacterized protein n=1 Tax=Plenodomus tracheiphilus IPT5 TaxID=1408161 RepID=A0A6A7BL21_9PLEO|nr:hypothetical protein T440DRAFT_536182 [Plenodomus tracheiphilus IPT5]
MEYKKLQKDNLELKATKEKLLLDNVKLAHHVGYLHVAQQSCLSEAKEAERQAHEKLERERREFQIEESVLSRELVSLHKLCDDLKQDDSRLQTRMKLHETEEANLRSETEALRRHRIQAHVDMRKAVQELQEKNTDNARLQKEVYTSKIEAERTIRLLHDYKERIRQLGNEV